MPEIEVELCDIPHAEIIPMEISSPSEGSSHEIRDDFKTLHELVLDNEPSHNVIRICGMGGIGKTTLARKLYEDASFIKHFDSRAWVPVGQTFQPRDIATDILLSLSTRGITREEIQKMGTTQLIEQLYNAQKGRNCLVVLDGVWSAKDVDTIGFAFPVDVGTRILITTRDSGAGKGYVHEMKFLNDDQSWELLKLQLIGGPVPNTEMDQMLKELVGFCGGIPLAITVLGGMLRQNELRWTGNLEKHDDKEEILKRVLDLSYNNLPSHNQLKRCFLYLGHFPPDQLIPVDKLYLLWMAEERELVLSREVAESNFFELVQRNLVMVKPRTTELKSCQLHLPIRAYCISKGLKEENFGVLDFKSKNKLPKVRTLAVYLDRYEHKDHRIAQYNFGTSLVPSLLFFDKDGTSMKLKWPTYLTDVNKDSPEAREARVLEFYQVDFKLMKLPKGIGRLSSLVYLSFRGCYLEEIPLSFGNLRSLETLDLVVRNSHKMKIPNILCNMLRLKHLYFPLVFQITTGETLKLDTLTMLEILENFHAGKCQANDLQNLESLQIIKAISDGNNEDLKTMIRFIERPCLLHSSLAIKNYDCYSTERLNTVNKLLKSDVHALNIEGHLGSGVLVSHMEFGKNINEIVFNGSEFEKDPMPILGMLPELRSLILCNDAFVGKIMVISAEKFPKLIHLELANLWTLEKWVVEDGAMPCLSTLVLEQCHKLDKFPHALMKIGNSLEIKIANMAEAFEEHARGLVNEERKLGKHFLLSVCSFK